MGQKLVDLTGNTYGRLKVEKRHHQNAEDGNVLWECSCICGNTLLVRSHCLKRGLTQSCGCLRIERVRAMVKKGTNDHPTKTHGMSQSPEFKTWSNIKNRCFNEKEKSYPDYGGRGITMSDEWKDSFETFYRDMGPRPSPNHTIERTRNNEGYNKDNCRWATRREQALNRRSSVYYEHNDQKKILLDWCKELNLNYRTVYYRIKDLGWTFEEAIFPIESMSIELDGETRTLERWCDLFRINPNKTYLRILRGETLENIIKE